MSEARRCDHCSGIFAKGETTRICLYVITPDGVRGLPAIERDVCRECDAHIRDVVAAMGSEANEKRRALTLEAASKS